MSTPSEFRTLLQISSLPSTARRLAAVLGVLGAIGSGAFAPAAANDESGFKPLFNGRDLAGWEGDPRFWSVQEGTITGQTTRDNPTKGNTFLIWRNGELDDFELRFSYRIDGGNSGVQYRSREIDKWVVSGYQADFEAGDTYSGILYEERARGILAQRGQKTSI
jgi:hypothetical protein